MKLLKNHESRYIRENINGTQKNVAGKELNWSFYTGKYGSVGCESMAWLYNASRLCDFDNISGEGSVKNGVKVQWIF